MVKSHRYWKQTVGIEMGHILTRNSEAFLLPASTKIKITSFWPPSLCRGSRILNDLGFLTSMVSQRGAFFIKQHGEMRSKLFAQEHTEKRGVCLHWTCPGRHVWKVCGCKQPHLGRPKAPQHRAPRCHAPAYAGSARLPAGSKAGEPWKQEFFQVLSVVGAHRPRQNLSPGANRNKGIKSY